MMVVDFFTET
jgi:hypothetical protein